MTKIFCTILVGGLAFASPLKAEFARVADEGDFRALISGKTLSRPLIKIAVLPEGAIQGTGARWAVTGNWSWKDGYFCRDMRWGDSDLGYNCQEVKIKGSRIRFTSDQGTGDSAVFRILEQ